MQLQHLRCILVQTTNISPVDVKFSGVLNRLLKEYLKVIPHAELEQFVKMVYDIICPLPMGIRIVLLMRVGKLKVPLPICSLAEIEFGQNSILKWQQISLAFLCGLQQPIILLPELRNEISELISCQPQDGPRFVDPSRVLCLLYTILSNPHIFKQFAEDGHLPGTFYAILFNTLTSRVVPLKNLAKECFVLLRDRYADLCSLDKHFEEIEHSPDKVFHLFSQSAERVGFYGRLMRIYPEQAAVNSIELFFRALFEYGAKSDVEKMKYITWLVAIVKVLTIKEFMLLPKVRESIVYDEGDSKLHGYVKTMVELCQHKEIPILTLCLKYITRFLAMFAQETMYLIMHCDFPFFVWSLLAELIPWHPIFFDAFLNVLSIAPDLSILPLSAVRVLTLLSSAAGLSSHPRFWAVCEGIFCGLLNKTSDHENHGPDDCAMLAEISHAIVNIFQFVQEVDRVFLFAKILLLPFFVESDISPRFVSNLYKTSPIQFREFFLSVIVQRILQLHPIVLQTLLPETIKWIKTDLSCLWS
jgi:hypothetical protein